MPIYTRMAKWSIKKVLVIGFVAASIAAALLTWSIFRVTTTIMVTATSVSQTYEVITAVKNLQSNLTDAEAGERGYVITGDATYLFPYLDALKKIQAESDLIRALISNNSAQLKKFANLQKLIQAKLQTIQMIVDTRESGGIDAAHQLVSIDEDQLEMNRIRIAAEEMIAAENALLNTRIEARNAASRHFWRSFGLLILIMFAGAAWQYTHVRRILRLEAQMKEHIRHLADHDALTNLPNRRLLRTGLDFAIAYAKRSGKMVAIMFIDLDGFKKINDSLGHQAGDELLRKVSERLVSTVRKVDTTARLGGDEFVVVLSELSEIDAATQVANKLNEIISEPYYIAGTHTIISASIGISLFPRDGQSCDALLAKADEAAYQAKAAGKNQYKLASA